MRPTEIQFLGGEPNHPRATLVAGERSITLAIHDMAFLTDPIETLGPANTVGGSNIATVLWQIERHLSGLRDQLMKEAAT